MLIENLINDERGTNNGRMESIGEHVDIMKVFLFQCVARDIQVEISNFL